MPSPRCAYGFFCDDIRMEMGGKPSFMGCYNGAMFLNSTLPTALPKLCTMVTLICDPDDHPEFLETFIKLPNGDEVMKNRLHPPKTTAESGASKVFYSSLLQSAGFLIPEEGALESWIRTETGNILVSVLKIKSILPPGSPSVPPDIS